MPSQKIRGITIELNADTAGILDGLKDINSSLSNTQRNLNDVNKLLKLDPENITLLAQKQEYLNKAIEGTEEKLRKQKEALESLKNADNANETLEQQALLAREIEDTNQKLNKYKGELDQTNKSLNEMGKNSEETANSINDTSDAIMALAQSEAFSRIADGAKKVYDALMECDEAADRFEFAMAKVNTLAQAGDGITQWGTDIKTLAADLGVSSADFAEGVYQAMSASVAAEDAIDFTANMTKLAIGGFTDSATAVDLVTTALNSYGLEASATEHIMDDLISTQNLGKTSVAELAAAMGKVIPTASAYNVNIDNLAAAYSELTAKGIKTKIATTQLNAMFQELGKAGTGVNDVLIELTGDTFGQFMAKGNSLGDVMEILWNYADQDSEAFMGLWSSSQAATAAFNLAGDSGTRFNELLGEMSTNAGLAEANFRMMADTGEMLDAKMSVALENLKIAIGDALGPVLDSMTEKGLAFLEPFTEFVEENPELVSAISGAVIGVTGLTTAVAACAGAVALLKAAFGDFTGVLGIFGAAAAVGAIGGLSVALGTAQSSAQDLAKSLKESKQATDEYIESFTKTDTLEELKNRILELNSAGELNATQMAQMGAAVAEWNEIADEGSQIVLDQTGHIENLTDAEMEYAEALAHVTEIEQELNTLNTEIEESNSKYNEALAEKTRLEEEYAEKVSHSREEQRGYQEAIADCDETMKLAQETIAEDGARIAELGEEYGYAKDYINEFNATSQETAEASAVSQEAIDALTKKLEEMSSAIQSSIQNSLDLTKQWSQEWDTSTADMTSNIDSQIDGITTWKDNIGTLADAFGSSQSAILEYLIGLGTQGAGLVQELVDTLNDSPEQLADWSDSMMEYLALKEDVSSEILETYTDLLADIGEEGAAVVEESMPLVNEAMATQYDTMQTDATTNKEAMVQTITEAVLGMGEAVDTNAPTVSTAVTTMMTQLITDAKAAIGMVEGGRSSAFYDLGRNIDQSIADGVADNASVITTALQNALDGAVSGISMSGLTSAINRALGEALG